MKFIAISTIALSLASSALAWNVNDYETDDCNIIGTDAIFRAYTGTDSNACHNFGAGESGSSCTQHSMAGGVVSCSDDILTSGSVFTGATQCEFFASHDCDGASRIVSAGTCVSGSYQSFSCVSEPSTNLFDRMLT